MNSFMKRGQQSQRSEENADKSEKQASICKLYEWNTWIRFSFPYIVRQFFIFSFRIGYFSVGILLSTLHVVALLVSANLLTTCYHKN